ncbi:GIY-YIG nuclease family protein [Candidatus Saccharibacteria bacterium]|nr:GIY-YIG nuclease family protein [Candidatus Saccharibacteria bacterium]
MSGYVYILTNPSFRDDWVKIGKSSRPVNIRSKELDNTAVPLPFEIYAVMKTEKYNEAEKQIHGLIDLVNPDMRIRKGREFFNVTPEKALSIFYQCARTLDDAEIEVVHDTHSIDPRLHNTDINSDGIRDHVQISNTGRVYSTKKQKLTFKLLNIPIGAELSFAENDAIKATVVNENSIIRLQDGTETTLSGAVVIIKRKLGTATHSEAYQGGVYWLYKGQRLTTIRKQIEAN